MDETIPNTASHLDPGCEPLMLFPADEVFDYRIRESARSRTVRLNMTPESGLVIVIPVGYDRRRIPAIIREKKSWIEKARRWAEDQRRLQTARPKPCIPDQVDLLAIGELWHVEAKQTGSSRNAAREHPEFRLLLSGNVTDLPGSFSALSRWTGRKAHAHLVPWLRRLSDDTGLVFTRAIVGNQRTRWASCSPSGTISLNQKLLFLPPHLARYVLIHELCHLRHMNHSKRFWKLVERHEPAWREHRRELGESWQLVPPWLDC